MLKIRNYKFKTNLMKFIYKKKLNKNKRSFNVTKFCKSMHNLKK